MDAAKYPSRSNAYVAVAVKATTGEVYSACSVRAPTALQAEEVAIALALTHPQCTTILSDSRSAIANYAKNTVCESAVNTVKHSAVKCGAVSDRAGQCRAVQCGAATTATSQPATPATYIRWFPAHTSTGTGIYPNRNETADAAARELTNREAPPRCSSSSSHLADGEPEPEQEPLVSYGEILQWYRLGRRSRPPPHPRLTRAEAVLYRQLQTNSVITPVLARHVCPEVYESVVCSECAQTNATLAHLLWGCDRHVPEPDGVTRLPEDITHAMNSNVYEVQLQTVQRLEAALAKQKRREATSEGQRDNTLTPAASRTRRSQRGPALRTT